MSAKVHSIISKGTKGTLVDIECHLSNNLPTIIIVGSASTAVGEAKERIRGAFATSHIMLPRKRVTINLAPADIPKADSGFDLAIAVAILAADGQVNVALDGSQVFIGELGLDGGVRAVRGIIGKILIGRAKGIKTFFIPAENLDQAQLIPKIHLVPVKSFTQLHGHLALGIPIETINTGGGRISDSAPEPASGVQISEVVGQEQAKRALEIAAAGGHNLFFSGPPGTGKSMLAKALQSVLPPLSREEMLEVTHLHSLASQDYEKIITERPFRSPHHSASHVAVVGGGSRLRPGEISLAHRGVLFFDELPEFDRDTLEALRQPLEDQIISLARAKETAQYPANFIMIATANPCPCGYFGSSRDCTCTDADRARYAGRISGPILDRIDLYCHVHSVSHNRLLTQQASRTQDDNLRQRIQSARARQAERFGNSYHLNADMNNSELKSLAKLSRLALKALNGAAADLQISARSYMRTVKIARTIADLAGSASIRVEDIMEAFTYKPETAL